MELIGDGDMDRGGMLKKGIGGEPSTIFVGVSSSDWQHPLFSLEPPLVDRWHPSSLLESLLADLYHLLPPLELPSTGQYHYLGESEAGQSMD